MGSNRILSDHAGACFAVPPWLDSQTSLPYPLSDRHQPPEPQKPRLGGRFGCQRGDLGADRRERRPGALLVRCIWTHCGNSSFPPDNRWSSQIGGCTGVNSPCGNQPSISKRQNRRSLQEIGAGNGQNANCCVGPTGIACIAHSNKSV